ncbi:MAG: prephenate dehydratase [Candidatus Acidiferrales bacterium]
MKSSARKAGQALRSPSAISGSTGVPVLRVAFQGEPGAFSEEAARRLLGPTVRTVPRPTFESLFDAVRVRRGSEEQDRPGGLSYLADCILVPLENSLAGAIQRNYDLLLASGLRISGEVVLPIAHHLIGCPGARAQRIATVQSHPVALAQCERFFAANPHFARVAADDTAGSVREIVERGDPRRAAIGSEYAASLYGGRILRRHVEDHRENYTRFVLAMPSRVAATFRSPLLAGASRQRGGLKAAATPADKVSLVFELRHRPGALCRALESFASRGLNLMKIESRPIPGRPWEYRFYVDLRISPARATNGSAASDSAQEKLSAALTELKRATTRLHLLGQYASSRGNGHGHNQ